MNKKTAVCSPLYFIDVANDVTGNSADVIAGNFINLHGK